MITRSEIEKTVPDGAVLFQYLEVEIERFKHHPGRTMGDFYRDTPFARIVESSLTEHGQEFAAKSHASFMSLMLQGAPIELLLPSFIARGILIGWGAALAAMEVYQLGHTGGEEMQEKLDAGRVRELAGYVRKQRVYMCGETNDLASHACRFIGRPEMFPDSVRVAKTILPQSWLHVQDWPEIWRKIWWRMGAEGREHECLADFLEEMADTL